MYCPSVSGNWKKGRRRGGNTLLAQYANNPQQTASAMKHQRKDLMLVLHRPFEPTLIIGC